MQRMYNLSAFIAGDIIVFFYLFSMRIWKEKLEFVNTRQSKYIKILGIIKGIESKYRKISKLIIKRLICIKNCLFHFFCLL